MHQLEIINTIEAIAPLAIAAPWDSSGIQVASEREHIEHVAICLDPTPESVQAALNAKADFILSHHPLSMDAYRLATLGPLHTVIRALMQKDVPLYAAHTSLDANPKGPVSWLADELGLVDRALLEPLCSHVFADETRECGFGIAGALPSPMPFEQFIERLSFWIDRSAIRATNPVPQKIARIGICPGSGSSLAKAANKLGCDVLLTGDVKYHTAVESPLCLIDVGHFALEEHMMRIFADHLAAALPKVKVSFMPSCDPFMYP